ncbi:MAG TPA: outer membrane beta-barrel protein, partial [Steroidobacteraceae bacterium]|nr:outer membrane beta-barrel protein [Steroidobacteraceae bacterium]
MPASTTTALRSLATSAFIALLSLLSTPGRGLSAEPTPDEQRIDALTHEVQELRTLVRQLEGRIDELEGHSNAATAPGAGPPATVVRNVPAAPAAPAAAAGDLLRGATINAMLDTYYEYNTNDPIGRVNYLRAYDVSSNSFSLNQADLVLESAPQLSAGKRYGVRIDLQFGQATETLQGSLANELRPEIWRNVFQAYGSYVFPIEGEPLQLDFGKWASSIGIEDNYTKDQINYTRSYWYSYLPFYHSGLRASYRINDELTLNYWITNGTQQTEDFNNFKDQLVGFVLTPTPAVVWNFNLYLGQEHPDVVRQNLPTQPGMAFEPIPNAPNGHLQIYDSYATWQATPALL